MSQAPSGKDKLQRWLRLYLGGYNISGDARTFSTAENMFEGADLTGWSEAVYNFIADGRRRVGLRGFQALLNDTAVSGAFTLLEDADNIHNLSLVFGGGGEPAVPDPAYLLSAVQINDAAGWDGQAATISADFLHNAGTVSTLATSPWGVLLSPATSISATTTNASHDNGAASTDGAYAHLHVLATSSGNFAIVVEHSANDSAWATLMTFTADGGTVTSERQTASGTVDRYTRVVATRTGGSTTPVVTFARN